MKVSIFLFIALSQLLFAQSVAKITALRGEANIYRNDKVILAKLGTDLKQEDSIHTGKNTKVQLIFKDETIISIGNDSEFSIQEYLFENNPQPKAKFSLLKGAMRTVTGRIGKIAPQNFTVATKTVTIGIRGTNFSLFINEDSSSNAFCSHGAISVSIAGVSYTVQQGFVLTLSPHGKVEIKEFTHADLKAKKVQHFTQTEAKSTQSTNKNELSNKHALENMIPISPNTAQLDTTRTTFQPAIPDVIENITEIIQASTQEIATLQDTKVIEKTVAEEASRLAAEEASRLAAEEASRLAAEEASRLAAEEASRLATEKIERLQNQETEAIKESATMELLHGTNGLTNMNIGI